MEITLPAAAAATATAFTTAYPTTIMSRVWVRFMFSFPVGCRHVADSLQRANDRPNQKR